MVERSKTRSREWRLTFYLVIIVGAFAAAIWVVNPPGAPRPVYIVAGAVAALARLVINERLRAGRIKRDGAASPTHDYSRAAEARCDDHHCE